MAAGRCEIPILLDTPACVRAASLACRPQMLFASRCACIVNLLPTAVRVLHWTNPQ